MNYQNEDDLKADGFVLTTNAFHTGNGEGKVYEKIVHEVDQPAQRVYFGVDTEGAVTPWTPASVAPVVVEEEVVEPKEEVVVAPEQPASAAE